VPVVFDHFGSARGALGVSQPGLGDLLEPVRSGKACIKTPALSHLYAGAGLPGRRTDRRGVDRDERERIVWGTDWPHPDSASGGKATDITPHRRFFHTRT
jgi:hypothetical protein